MIKSADLALANMEESAQTVRFHPHARVHRDPGCSQESPGGGSTSRRLLRRIGDGEDRHLADDRDLRERNVPFGAGKNSPRHDTACSKRVGQGRHPRLRGSASRYYGATLTTIGDAPLDGNYIKQTSRGPRRRASVIVFLTGASSTLRTSPFSIARRLMIDAGADMVIAIIRTGPVGSRLQGQADLLSLGISRSTRAGRATLEGVTLELTFRGGTRSGLMNPHILPCVQPICSIWR